MPANIGLILLLTIALVALVDYIPRLINATKKQIRVKRGYGKVPDYVIMPTVYGDISYLKNLKFLKRYSDKVVVCTSAYESEEFYADLDRICQANGLRFVKAEVPLAGGKPIKNAYTIYKGAFADLRKLGVREDTPCILIDADTYAHDNVNNLVRTFKKHKLQIASLRCEVANPTTLFEVLQDYEYKLAMDNRLMDPWLTSGACNMATAGVFKHVFSRHSHFFAGGDIEIGKLAQVMGYRIGHIRFSFYTEVPNTFKAWYNQRIIWFAGGVRHHMVNIASYSWRHYFIFFYNSLIVYLLLPLRWVELINYPLTFFLLVGVSYAYLLLATIGRGWRKEYIFLPAYSFMQSMIILPVAMVRYVKYAWQQKSLGLLRYDLSHLRRRVRLLFFSLNMSFAVMAVGVAVWFTAERAHYWYVNGPFAKLFL